MGQNKKQIYKIEYLEWGPEILDQSILYLVGENTEYLCAQFLCPCDCQAKIHIPLFGNQHPVWKLIVKSKSPHIISLSPSILRLVGCKSHFHITENEVKWC